MATEHTTLSTMPLSRADQANLLEFLPEDIVDLQPVKLAAGELGEPATAIAIISLSMVAITGLCAWVASKGRGVSLSLTVTAPGVSTGFSMTINDRSKPEAVRKEVEKQGIPVPEK
jgi:hypothetical protein